MYSDKLSICVRRRVYLKYWPDHDASVRYTLFNNERLDSSYKRQTFRNRLIMHYTSYRFVFFTSELTDVIYLRFWPN